MIDLRKWLKIIKVGALSLKPLNSNLKLEWMAEGGWLPRAVKFYLIK